MKTNKVSCAFFALMIMFGSLLLRASDAAPSSHAPSATPKAILALYALTEEEIKNLKALQTLQGTSVSTLDIIEKLLKLNETQKAIAELLEFPGMAEMRSAVGDVEKKIRALYLDLMEEEPLQKAPSFMANRSIA